MEPAGQCAAAILATAMLIDLLVGEPPNALHPVVWIGNAIKLALRASPRTRKPAWELLFGCALAIVIPAAVFFACAGLLAMTAGYPWLETIVAALLLKTAFAIRALGTSAKRVLNALLGNDIAKARDGVRHLCSRDPSELQEEEVVGSTIESVAENTCDSFVAPVFYFVLFGVPGALAYRAVNTLDSMVGYHGKFEYLGKASARLDDLLNFIPARLTALLFLTVGAFFGGDTKQGWRIWYRDHAKPESPNAGHSMAAMAGLLGVRLEKRDCYALGDARCPLDAGAILQAWRIALVSMLLFGLIVGGAQLV